MPNNVDTSFAVEPRPNVPFWGSITSLDKYKEAPVEEKLWRLDRWIEDRYAEMPDIPKDTLFNFNLSNHRKRALIKNPDLDLEGQKKEIENGFRWDEHTLKQKMERTRVLDARIHATREGRYTHASEEIVFSDSEQDWINTNNNGALPIDWTVRRGLDETAPEDFEVNYS